MVPVIHLRDAVALLGRFPALAGVDLDVYAGEVVLVQGPNGAGKTTLLRAVGGLVPIVRGTAQVMDIDVVADPKRVRPLVGLLGHGSGLYDDLSASENVRFWAAASAMSAADARGALTRVALAPRLWDLPVDRLSAGQRRRVSLASFLVRRPSVWLLDEPHAGLDADARDLVDGLITEGAQAGATVMFASHELERAEAVAHRSVTVAGGATVADDAERPTARPTEEPTS